MAGAAGRSGGSNRLSLEEHRLRNTYRADRHGHLTPTPVVGAVALADRKHVLAGLAPGPRRIASELLDSYGPWCPATLEVLRSYVHSCERLERLQAAPADDTRALHREVRCNLALLRNLELER
jgi:hypothetical protein